MTYSINSGTIITYFLGNTANDFLNLLPNNTFEKIVPKDVRDSVFTVWENIAYKPTGAFTQYAGYAGKDILDRFATTGFKTIIGKPVFNSNNLFNDTLTGYNNANINYPNADLIIHNSKPDNFANQNTKVLITAGDNTDAPFKDAPYIEVIAINGGTPSYRMNIHMPLSNSELNIDADNINIGSVNSKVNLIYDPNNSNGILNKPAGAIGDLQFNLDNCFFGNISGASASVGSILILGASNSPYWGNPSSLLITPLNTVLQVGNVTNGNNIVITDGDRIELGSSGVSIFSNGTFSNIVGTTASTLVIDVNEVRINAPNIGTDRALVANSSGNLEYRAINFNAAGVQNVIQLSDGAGGLSAVNNFRFETTSSSLLVNRTTVGISYAANISANVVGGLNIDGVSNSIVSGYSLLHIRDVTTATPSSVLNLLYTNSERTLYISPNQVANTMFYGTSWSTLANTEDNIFIQSRVNKNRLTLQSVNNITPVIISLQTGALKDVTNKISSNESGSGNDLSILSKASNKNIRIGYFSGSTITSVFNIYTLKQSGVSPVTNKSVAFFGNRAPSFTISSGTMSAGNQVAVGVNIIPSVDFHVFGLEANAPKVATFIERDGNSNNIYLESTTTTNIITNDIIDFFINSQGAGYIGVNRLDVYFDEVPNPVPAGTRITITNLSSGEFRYTDLSLDLVATNYDTTAMRNIFVASSINNNPEYNIILPGQTHEFIAYSYVSFSYLIGLIESNAVSNADVLGDNDIIWVKKEHS